MSKAKVHINNSTFWFLSCIGTGVSIVTSLLIALLLSTCTSNGYMELSASSHAVIVGQFLSSFAGSLVAGKTSKGDSKILSCCCTAAIFYLVYICIGMLVFGGLTSLAFSGMLACATGCIAAILTCIKGKRNNTGKKRKKRSR